MGRTAGRPPNKPLESYLQALRDEYARSRIVPAFTRLQRVFGVSGSNAVLHIIGRLVDAGYLERCGEPGGLTRYVPTSRFFEVPLAAANVRAGRPESICDNDVDQMIAVDEYLIEKPASTRMYQIPDDSLADQGIFAGDMAIVELNRKPQLDNVVLARLDGSIVLGVLACDERGFYLRSGDQELLRKTSMETLGVMTGLVRKMT